MAKRGLRIVERNWRCDIGEIDIVAMERGGPTGRPTLVFCEVKCRRGLGFGSPLEAITYDKRRKLRELVGRWLGVHPAPGFDVRLDAVGVLWPPGRSPVIDHVRGIE